MVINAYFNILFCFFLYASHFIHTKNFLLLCLVWNTGNDAATQINIGSSLSAETISFSPATFPKLNTTHETTM